MRTEVCTGCCAAGKRQIILLYHIQPVISANGKLYSPMLIILVEICEIFGWSVVQPLFRPGKIYIQVSAYREKGY